FSIHRGLPPDIIAKALVDGNPRTEEHDQRFDQLLDQIRERLVSPTWRTRGTTLVLVGRGLRVVAADERIRWDALLHRLRDRTARGELTDAQHTAFLEIVRRAHSSTPSQRRPAVGLSVDHELQMSWAFDDLPGHSFTVSILPDGRVDWFYRDANSGRVDGTADEPTHSLPGEAYDLLAAAFGSQPGGTG
ncbi:MAG: hypothetical protein JNK45_07140, partial [Myxococcales bacterium]|nr:hypothetical protein [Myxococcales bacterium]